MSALRYSLTLMVAVLLAAPTLAQERDRTLPRVSPNASTSFQIGVTEVSVSYGAPSVRERTIFGDLVPYGEVWRTGANEATTITVSTDVLVEGQPLPAGTYMIATIPGPDSWTVIFNDNAQQWGTYQYDAAHDVLRVRVQPQRAPARETMAITFDNATATDERDGADMVIHWDRYAAPVRIESDTQSHIRARGDAAMRSDDWRDPFAFAQYALQTGRHLDRARFWARAAADQHESFATLAVQARILAANGDHAAAVAAGERALALAAELAEEPRGAAQLRDDVADWRDAHP